MIVLGMDLSISCPGFCVGELSGGKVSVLHLSHVKTSPRQSHGQRLKIIFDHLEKILFDHPEIEVIAREKAIPATKFPNHIQTVMVLNKVVGVSDLLTNGHGYLEDAWEVPPTTLKKALTGSGKGTKEEVQAAVLEYLESPVKFKNTDESDAAAVVVCYGKEKKLLG